MSEKTKTEGLSPATVGVRAHDMHHGLVKKHSGLINRYMKRTKVIGAAAQISTVIKDLEVIEDYGQLEVSAGEIGIDESLLEKALRELQEVGFVRLKEAGGEIRRVDITVPLLRDMYTDLGKRWTDTKPTDHEKVSLEVLDEVSLIPAKARDLQKRYNLNATDFEIIRDVGINAGYLRFYRSRSDGEEVVCSPLHWDESPQSLEVLLKKYASSDVVKAIKTVRAHQGLPADQVKDQVLQDAISSGLLPTPTVDSMRGRRAFLFTPGQSLKSYEKSILDKARAIIACVRYGEVFGTITKIFDPLLLLRRLRERKRLNPHSEALRQYETLRNLGVGRISRVSGTSKYMFHLIDNDENLRALDLAIAMLQVGEPIGETKEVQTARQLLLPGTYVNPTGTRATFQTVEPVAHSVRTIEHINDLIRGVSIEID